MVSRFNASTLYTSYYIHVQYRTQAMYMYKPGYHKILHAASAVKVQGGSLVTLIPSTTCNYIVLCLHFSCILATITKGILVNYVLDAVVNSGKQ